MDKALLFTPRLPEAEVTLPGIGVVRVRGLSRIEALHMNSVKGVEAIERRMVVLGMLDPVLTDDEVKQWQRASIAGELEAVTDTIAALSGMGKDSPKQAYADFRDETGSGERVLSGAEAGDDSVSSPGGDE